MTGWAPFCYSADMTQIDHDFNKAALALAVAQRDKLIQDIFEIDWTRFLRDELDAGRRNMFQLATAIERKLENTIGGVSV